MIFVLTCYNPSMKSKSLLGIDLGTSRAGLAVSHGFMAEALESLDYQNKNRFFLGLKKIIDEQKIETIVMGLPLKDGQETDQSRWIKKESKEIGQELGFEIEFVDEAFSSTEADRYKGDRDSQSARIILEQYLNGK